jgi:hypothetical protein
MADLLRSDVSANEAKSTWVSRQRRPGDPAVAAAIAVVRLDALRPDGLLHQLVLRAFRMRPATSRISYSTAGLTPAALAAKQRGVTCAIG